MIRDQYLAISGLLSDKIGGPSVKPYELSQSFKPMGKDKGEIFIEEVYIRFGKELDLLSYDSFGYSKM